MSEAPSLRLLPLELERVSFEAGGRRIIDGATVSIGPEGSSVILGPNGAGKSVLMRLCHGLLQPTAGAIRWRGPDGSDAGRVRRRQAMVFQKPVLLRRTALGNITYALGLAGVRGEDCIKRARDALERVGLLHIAQQPARALSGGEQQRLAIARAWALVPAVLFLDEPTASLDPAAAQEVERLIAEIAQSGTKIIMTTHSLGLAARVGAEVVFLWKGRVIEQADATEFFRQPGTPEARAFVRSELP